MVSHTVDKLFKDKEGRVLLKKRHKDGYVNMAPLMKYAKKPLYNYKCNERSKKFMKMLAKQIHIPVDNLIESIITGPNEERGSWVHPMLALDVINWASVEFGTELCRWINEQQKKDETFDNLVWQTACEVEYDHYEIVEHSHLSIADAST